MYGTAKNQRFRDDMARLEDNYNDGNDMTPEDVMKKAEVKYNNLKKSGKWDIADPRDVQIVALSTVLKSFIDHNNEQASNNGGRGKCRTNQNGNQNNRNAGEWLAPPVDGKEEKTIDGRLAKWCAKCNKGNGKWVVSHNTATHDGGFIDKLKKRAAEKREESKEEASSSNNADSKKLKLSSDLKAAMETLTGQAVGDAESDEEDF